jgi:hypothetical protein
MLSKYLLRPRPPPSPSSTHHHPICVRKDGKIGRGHKTRLSVIRPNKTKYYDTGSIYQALEIQKKAKKKMVKQIVAKVKKEKEQKKKKRIQRK